MITPAALPPAKPILFMMEERLNPYRPWVFAGDVRATCCADAVLDVCNSLNEKSENVRVVGLAYMVPDKSAGE